MEFFPQARRGEEFKRGRIREYNAARGFGFITSSAAPANIFFHISAWSSVEDPRPNRWVRFHLEQQSKQKFRATHVFPLRDDELQPEDFLENRGEEKQRGKAERKQVSSLYGTVTALQLMYGFLTLSAETVQQIPFEHRTETQVFFYRKDGKHVQIGDTVRFHVRQEPVVGTVAFNLGRVVTQVKPNPDRHDLRATTPLYELPYLLRNLSVGARFQEDDSTEFKLGTHSHNVAQFVAHLCEKYVVGFLNARGGNLYVGIHDNGLVAGVKLTRHSRDQVQLKVAAVLKRVRPVVDSTLYKIRFVPVADYFDRVTERVVYLNRSVIALEVHQGPGAEPYRNSKGVSYVRLGAQTAEMTAEMLKEHRRRRQDNSQDQALVIQRMQENMQAARRQIRSLQRESKTAEQALPVASDTSVLQIDMKLVQQLQDMGYARSQVLDTMYKVHEQGMPVTTANFFQALEEED
jgi:cold shock CspA family protein